MTVSFLSQVQTVYNFENEIVLLENISRSMHNHVYFSGIMLIFVS